MTLKATVLGVPVRVFSASVKWRVFWRLMAAIDKKSWMVCNALTWAKGWGLWLCY
jgi:hypothetical protein